MTQNIPGFLPELEKDLYTFSTTSVLPSQMIEEFIKKGHIVTSNRILDDQLQPASIDLRLGPIAYQIRASFLPGRASLVLDRVEELKIQEIDLSKPSVLERGCVYIVPLVEELYLPPGISGKANPKSTIGRLDIFTRLVPDYSTEFERVPAGYKGKLYLEIVPRTFNVLVQEGARMNQLRFMQVSPLSTDTQPDYLQEEKPRVYLENGTRESPGNPMISNGLWVSWVSVDLQGSNGSEVVGYKAKKYAPLIDLAKLSYYDPSEFWDPIVKPKKKNIILDPEDFYILASKERIEVPPNLAAEMIAYDPSVGEFRVHYAGFFDPGFGYGQTNFKGAHAVLEVRSHEVPFLLEDGQIVGRLIFERLQAKPQKIYGPNIGSSYQGQALSLSKQFKFFL
jgi:dCTP deaminase